MNMRNKRVSLSVLLIISILFLGMCFEDYEAGSFFQYRLSLSSASVLREVADSTLSGQVYTEEYSIGQQAEAVIRQAGSSTRSQNSRESDFHLLSAEILWHIFPIIFLLWSHEHGLRQLGHFTIVDYIHHKDGKKA